MNYTLKMDFWTLGAPHGPHLLDFSTINLMVTLTYFLQALVVGFQVRLTRRYHGLRMFLASTLVLAVGSLVLVVQSQLSPGPVGLVSSVLMIWGMALQYGALVRFTDQRPSWWLFGGLAGGGTVVLVALAFVPGTTPFVPVREALNLPFLVALALTFRRVDFRTYRFGVLLTALPLAGVGTLSMIRLVRSLVAPGAMTPRPNVSNDIDAVLMFAFSFLWTAGFLLMVNQRLQSELAALASRDPLTDCLNRRAMNKLLAAEHERFQRYQRPYTVVLIDLDRFKAINDTLGHAVGDRVLVETAQVLKTTLRAGDSLSRWGGEEFLILLPETDAAAGAALAERLRQAMAARDFGLGRPATFSAGVASPEDRQSVESVCARADKALYQAKQTRNQVCLAP
jgi:diguanylate cyclase (GGDEF)-like protein